MSILFSDFLGDLDVLTEHCLYKAASTVSAHDINCIVWYVPKNSLDIQLKRLKALNVTEEEHWNLASLNIDRIKTLVET